MGRQNNIDRLPEDKRSQILRKRFTEKKTLEEIAKELTDAGSKVSYQSVRRFTKRYEWLAKILELDGLNITDTSLIEQSQKLQQLSNGVLFETFMTLLDGKDDLDVEKITMLKDLVNSTSIAARSIANVSKTKFNMHINQKKFIEVISELVTSFIRNSDVETSKAQLLFKDFLKEANNKLKEIGLDVVHGTYVYTLDDNLQAYRHLVNSLVKDTETLILEIQNSKKGSTVMKEKQIQKSIDSVQKAIYEIKNVERI